jgi:hypothetical protein
MKIVWHTRRREPDGRANGANDRSRTGADVWNLLLGLLAADVERLWRRLLRRPEPPTPFVAYRARRGNGPPEPPPRD